MPIVKIKMPKKIIENWYGSIIINLFLKNINNTNQINDNQKE